MSQAIESVIPKRSKPLLDGFRVFSRRFLRKHFHALAANFDALHASDIADDDSLVVYANHASWWDPLAAMFMADVMFPEHSMYAPIDAEAFQKYRMFGRMGFFPVEQESLQGAQHFLRVSRAILTQPKSSIWITPEGRFTDIRDHTAPLMPGMAHLAHSFCKASQSQVAGHRVWFVPTAVEYVFWEERLPEALLWVGEPLVAEPSTIGEATRDSGQSKAAWQDRLSGVLRCAQRELAVASIQRQSDRFEVLLASHVGSFFFYDWWRRAMGAIRGKSVDVAHSDKLTGPK